MLLRMRSWSLMVRSAATPRVSNHLAVYRSHDFIVVGHRRGDHQKYQIDQSGIGDRMFDTGRQKDKIVLAHHMVLAGDFHQAFAFEHVIDLLLYLVLVPRDMRHRLIHRDPIIQMPRAGGFRHHQWLRQRAAEVVGKFAPGHFSDVANEGAVLFKGHSTLRTSLMRDKFDSLAPCDLPEYKCAQHRDRVRRGAIKMAGGFTRGVKPR